MGLGSRYGQGGGEEDSDSKYNLNKSQLDFLIGWNVGS